MRARLRPSILLAALIATAPPVRAADEAERAAARAAITRQVEALRRDDAGTAYAEAAPGIRELFPTPEVFLGMVRTNYAPVYRHRSFVFGPAREGGGTTLSQTVTIQDVHGIDWIAEYSLERQGDGQWRISGCQLSKAQGTNL